jgi:hypothetical protein
MHCSSREGRAECLYKGTSTRDWRLRYGVDLATALHAHSPLYKGRESTLSLSPLSTEACSMYVATRLASGETLSTYGSGPPIAMSLGCFRSKFAPIV